MSTRYVWGRYGTIDTFTVTETKKSSEAYFRAFDDYSINISIYKNAENSQTSRNYKLSNRTRTIFVEKGQGATVTFNEAPCYLVFDFSILNVASPISDPLDITSAPYSNPGKEIWYIPENGTAEFVSGSNGATHVLFLRNAGDTESIRLSESKGKGSYISDVSGSSQGPYPPCLAAPPALW